MVYVIDISNKSIDSKAYWCKLKQGFKEREMKLLQIFTV